MFFARRHCQILNELEQLRKEVQLIMPSIADVKAAVSRAASDVKEAVAAAVAKETTEISAQIQTLKNQIGSGTPITQDDLDEILASVSGIAPAATSAVNAISTGDGA